MYSKRIARVSAQPGDHKASSDKKGWPSKKKHNSVMLGIPCWFWAYTVIRNLKVEKLNIYILAWKSVNHVQKRKDFTSCHPTPVDQPPNWFFPRFSRFSTHGTAKRKRKRSGRQRLSLWPTVGEDALVKIEHHTLLGTTISHQTGKSDHHLQKVPWDRDMWSFPGWFFVNFDESESGKWKG